MAFVFSCILVAPQQIQAQSYEDYYNAGYILGASIRQAVDNKRARQAEQERMERERLEADRAYELEQQRIANERYAIQQREAEARRAEEERLRIAQEAKKAEEERLRLAQEAKIAEEERLRLIREVENSQVSNNSNKFIESRREYNSEVKLLSLNNPVVFYTDKGEEVSLLIKDYMSGDSRTLLLGYENKCDEKHRLVCNRVTIKVKYYDDEEEYTFTDACAIDLAPCYYIDYICGSKVQIEETKYLLFSEAFFSLEQNKYIERIRISFTDTQIK